LIRNSILAAIALVAIVFVVEWTRVVRSQRETRTSTRPSVLQIAIGFVTDFLDTLGIGSFATTATAFKTLRVVYDERIVGTMIVGHSLPVVAQAFIFLVVVQVDPRMLAMLTFASILGAWFGAGIASRLPRRPIQIGIGIGLFAAAFFMLSSQLGMFPAGGTAVTLTTEMLIIALVINFILGITLMLGIGNYAPSLIFFSLLGLDPRAVFPIMMTSGALMAMAGGLRFMKAGCFDRRAALGLTLGGIPGALVAGLIVRSLPLGVLRWMVIIVVLYAAAMMMKSALARRHSSVAQMA
jgi:uncharacterized membrane protein YfcA